MFDAIFLYVIVLKKRLWRHFLSVSPTGRIFAGKSTTTEAKAELAGEG